MMSVLEYANDMNLSVDEVLKKCESLKIQVNGEDDLLDDDSIVELDNAFSSEEESVSENEVDEEIIKKMDLDDYYDEVVDTLVDKKHTSNDSSKIKKKAKKNNKEKDLKSAKKAMYKSKEKLVSNDTSEDTNIMME